MFTTIKVNKRLIVFCAFLAVAAAAGLWAVKSGKAIDVVGAPVQARTINLVTGEFESVAADGKTKIEAYRFDPGTVPVRKGETVTLVIRGVSGGNHPFYIEGMNIQGEIKQGLETKVTFKADKEGIYRLICPTHSDAAHGGPMIGYIVVN